MAENTESDLTLSSFFSIFDSEQLSSDTTSTALIGGENKLEVLLKLPDTVSGSYRIELWYNGTSVDTPELSR